MQGGQLQVIVNDARYEFYNEYRGNGRPPQFNFGSRGKAGSVTLRSSTGSLPRADWVALPLTATAAAAAPIQAAPAAAAPAVVPPRPAAAAAAQPPAPSATPALRPRDPGFADEVEQRLTTLKRLRDRGLISEEEFQQKRREILQAL